MARKPNGSHRAYKKWVPPESIIIKHMQKLMVELQQIEIYIG